MRSIMSIALTAVMLLTVLTGCGRKNNNVVNSAATTAPVVPTAEANRPTTAENDLAGNNATTTDGNGNAVNDMVVGTEGAVNGVVNGAEDAVNGVVNGAEEAVNGVVNGAENAVNGVVGGAENERVNDRENVTQTTPEAR